MSSLPAFTAEGFLPAGDYEMTIEQLYESNLVKGPADLGLRGNWDVLWRNRLVENLAVMVDQLRQVGVTEIFVDGSFVQDKDHPNDIDGYFVCSLKDLVSGELQRKLNLLDPHKIWTWDPDSRRPYRGYHKKQLPMWHQYRVDLYPHYGQLSGICDDWGHELEFPSAFRRSRGGGQPRGIVKIVGGTS